MDLLRRVRAEKRKATEQEHVVLDGKTFFDGIINNPNKASDYFSLSTGYPFVGTVNIVRTVEFFRSKKTSLEQPA